MRDKENTARQRRRAGEHSLCRVAWCQDKIQASAISNTSVVLRLPLYSPLSYSLYRIPWIALYRIPSIVFSLSYPFYRVLSIVSPPITFSLSYPLTLTVPRFTVYITYYLKWVLPWLTPVVSHSRSPLVPLTVHTQVATVVGQFLPKPLAELVADYAPSCTVPISTINNFYRLFIPPRHISQRRGSAVSNYFWQPEVSFLDGRERDR
jgi:hypothetical protein